MIIKNYPQFSKKTFFLGLDRKFIIFFLIIFCILWTFFSIIPIISPMLFIIIGAILYITSVYSFKKNPYWFEQFIIKRAFSSKYKFSSKTNKILGR